MQTATNPATGEKVYLVNGAWTSNPAGAQPAPSSGPVTLGTPKPVKPEVRQVGDSLGVIDSGGGFTPTYTAPKDPDKAPKPQFIPQGATQMMLPDGRVVPVPGAVNRLPPEKMAELKGQQKALGGFESLVDQLEQSYNQRLAGSDKGGIMGMGGDRNLGGYLPGVVAPDNKIFNDLADSLIGPIASAQGLTGGELNSLAEMKARFGPMLPSASDSDENIRLKIGRLREMARGERAKVDAQLGEASPMPTPADAPKSFEGGNGQRIFDPQNTQQIALNDGGTQRIDDPILAGVNGKISAMLKGGAPMPEVAAYIESVGIPLDNSMTQQLGAIAKFREENPSYKGNYTVDIDNKLVPMSGLRSAVADVANSPVAAGVISAANTLTGNHLDNIVEAGGGNGALANIGIDLLRDQNPKSSFLGDMAGGAGLLASGRGALAFAGRGAAPATAAFSGRAIGADAALGAYIGSGADGTNVLSVPNALAGAVAGAGGGVLGRGAVNTGARALSPTGGALAPAYAEGVRPTIGQRMGGVFDRAEQAFASVPLVGGIQRAARNNVVEQWQAGAFNKALREVGTQLPQGVRSGTQAHAYMQRTFNQSYDKARSGLTFRQDAEFDSEFTQLMQNEVAGLGNDGQRVFKSYVDRGSNMLRARGGVLDGQDYKNLVSRIEAKVRGLRKNPSGDTELADALEGLSITLDKAARRHSAPEAVQALDAADRGYVMAVLIEEAGRKAGTDMGEFSGKQLEGAIRSNSGRRSRQALRGEAPLQDYAAAGVRLGNSVPDSGTPERLATMGGMGAAAHFVDPTMLTPWALNTLANVPGGKQAVNLLVAPNRKGLDPARRRLMERAYLGGLLSAPSAQITVAE